MEFRTDANLIGNTWNWATATGVTTTKLQYAPDINVFYDKIPYMNLVYEPTTQRFYIKDGDYFTGDYFTACGENAVPEQEADDIDEDEFMKVLES